MPDLVFLGDARYDAAQRLVEETRTLLADAAISLDPNSLVYELFQCVAESGVSFFTLRGSCGSGVIAGPRSYATSRVLALEAGRWLRCETIQELTHVGVPLGVLAALVPQLT